ncbi:MAG: DUF1592 domain-containing protein [Planctomycetota bacterium]
MLRHVWFPLVFPLLCAAPAGAQEPDFETDVLDFLDKHCLHCHEGSKAEAEVDLGRYLSLEEARAEPEDLWLAGWKAWDQAMPPPRHDSQPTEEERAKFLAWLDAEQGLGSAPPQPQVVMRRMNRSMYRHAVEDWLGVEVPVEVLETLPQDETGDGFDNVGASLTMAEDAVLRYLEAAEVVAALAVVDRNPEPKRWGWSGRDMEAPNYSGNDAALWSSGNATVHVRIDKPGRYLLKVRAHAQQAGEEAAMAALLVDARVKEKVSVDAPDGEEMEFPWEIPLEKGEHRLAMRFLNDYWNPDAPEGTPRDRNLYISSFSLEGPLDPPQPTTFQQRLWESFPLEKKHPATAKDYSKLVKALSLRAWGREAERVEWKRLQKMTSHLESWEETVRWTLTAILTSPRFLFDGADMGLEPEALMAVRLSRFLWSSVPDEELWVMASEPGWHRDEQRLLHTVDRMLADPKHRAWLEDFFAQNFRIRSLPDQDFDEQLFPKVDRDLRQAMVQETLRLCDDILQHDRDLNLLLQADYTFVNRILAEHYGLDWEGIPQEGSATSRSGLGWRRVSLEGTRRRGILGHASILSATSLTTRTSPVRRGRWILDNLLGAAPPPPPADAGLLDESPEASLDAPLRQRLEAHRDKPQCISCHKVMDPLGFSLERFDAVGRLRDTVDGRPVDADGTLPDGTELEGLRDMVDVLEARKDFPRLLIMRLTAYALGRPLTPADRPMLEGILEEMDPEHPTLRAAIHAIVKSEAFRGMGLELEEVESVKEER